MKKWATGWQYRKILFFSFEIKIRSISEDFVYFPLAYEPNIKKTKSLENKKIKPLKISNFDGYWYLNALNEDNKYRTYHIKSIKQLKITNEKFTPDKKLLKNLDKAVNIWFDPQKEFISVELFAD